MVLFSIFYFPSDPRGSTPKWTWVTPGGIVGVVLWLASSAAFFWYVTSGLNKYGETYGTFASVVLLILWLFLSSLAILVGGDSNAELERQGEARSRSRS